MRRGAWELNGPHTTAAKSMPFGEKFVFVAYRLGNHSDLAPFSNQTLAFLNILLCRLLIHKLLIES